MTRYYCSGFDINNAFGHGLGDMFLSELKDTKSIVYIPGGADKMQKVKEKYVPLFTEHFKKVRIQFSKSTIINHEINSEDAQKAVREASLVRYPLFLHIIRENIKCMLMVLIRMLQMRMLEN